MTRNGAAVGRGGKQHRPGHVGRPPPEFAIDEIGEPAEKQAEGHRRSDHVEQRPQREAARAGEEDHRQRGAEKAAVERHAAVPDLEDLQRVGEVDRQIVEQHIADASAGDDADRRPDDEIVDVGGLHRRAGRAPQALIGDQPLGVPPADEDADDIGQRIPADGEGADLDQHRIDGGEGQDEERHRGFRIRGAQTALPHGQGQGSGERPPCRGARAAPIV